MLTPTQEIRSRNYRKLDFLKEIAESVLDPTAGGTVGLDTEGAETKKKRGKGSKGLAAAGGEGGEGSTTLKRK